MAVIDDLKAEYAQVASLRRQLTVNMKPSYTDASGTYTWTEYYDMLGRRMEAIRADIIREDGPFIVAGRGRPG